MPTYAMTAPNGKTYRVSGPPNATDDQVRAEILRQYPAAAKAAPPSQPTFTEDAGGYLKGIARGIATGDPAGLLARGGSYITDALGLTTGANDAINAAMNAGENNQTGAYRTGQVMGEIASVTPYVATGGGLLSAGGRRLAAGPASRLGPVVERIGNAMRTGGIGSGRTAAETAKLSKTARAGQLAERVAGGAAGGATGATLSGQDAGTGAAFGAGLPVVAGIVGKVGGKTVDLFKMPRQRAASVMREALGSNVEAARAAFAGLSPDDQRLARQVLVEAGIEPRTFMALGADVERTIPDQTAQVLGAQAAAREARLAQAGGGATATETRAAAEQGRRAVSRETGPQREAALARANVAGREVPAAEALASAARAAADNMTASGFVPRMRGLEGRSAEQIDLMAQRPDVFPEDGLLARTTEIAGSAGTRADEALATQLRLRDTARDLEDHVANLAGEGMTPLRIGPIVQQIRSMAAQPGTRADDLQRGALVKVANKLEGLADANGVIDARDLYQIRKTGLNDIVERLLSARAQPSSGTKERTAGLLASLRPLIDDAVETAGGTGWKDYLSRTRLGFEAVNRQELGAKAVQLAKDSPDEFVKLMRGERPKVVEDVLGAGQYDIGGMALADPNRYLALTQSANELNTLNRMGVLAGEGRSAATDLIGQNRPSVARNLTRMGLAAYPPVRIGADAAQMALSNTLAPRVRQELAQGMLSGRNALSLMNQYPTSLALDEGISRLPSGARNAIAQALMRGFGEK